jgi:hypothetical protein
VANHAIRLALWTACALSAASCQPKRDTSAYEAAEEAVGPVQKRLVALSASSECLSRNWSGRGRAPAGYIKGMTLAFAKSLCRLRKGRAPSSLTTQRAAGDTERDALSWYQTQLDEAGLDTDRAGADALVTLYTLGIGHGMRESTGKHCQGVDPAATDPTAVTAEAGLFQTSYNSSSASQELKDLLSQYREGGQTCFLEAFQEGVSCPKSSIVGSGTGAAFQKLAKSCPAFAVEYAMLTLRVVRKHYGPINRREAEVVPACAQLLEDVREEVELRPAESCDELL